MSVADLKITELMYNQGPSGIQFIEVTNTGTDPVSSNDFSSATMISAQPITKVSLAPM